MRFIKQRLFVMMLTVLIFGCTPIPDGSKPTLSLSHRVFYFNSDLPTQTMTISNIGAPGSILKWHIQRIDPNIIVSHNGQISGKIEANQTITLIVSTKTQSPINGKTFVVSSNGGTQTVYVNFTRLPGEGLESCGAFPPKQNLQAATRATGDFVPGQLLVKYRTPSNHILSTQAALQQQSKIVETDYHLRVQRSADVYRPALVNISGNVLEIAEQLSKDPRVEYAEPNYYLQTLSTPNDPLFVEQWNLSSFGLPQAWDIETGNSKEVVAAVIDSGFDMDHEDLVAKILPGCDFNNKDNDVNPFPGNTERINHGTHVAGIIGAVGNNNLGVSGVAYGNKTKILPIKVFEDQGVTGTLDNLINAILWASGIKLEGTGTNSHKADIINMSVGIKLSKTTQIKSLGDAIQQAKNQGVVLFAATGNQNSLLLYPAADPNVLAVGSVDEDFKRSSFSNYNPTGRTVDLMAPGGTPTNSATCLGVISTIPSHQYGCLAGTSMASPFAAGVAALLLSKNPNLTPDQVKARLINTALFDNQFMNKAEYGGGIICADKALGASTQCGQ